MYNETLADGTRIRCTSDGKLIVDQAAEGSPTGTYARYLFQGQLSNGSDFRQIYEVKFIECKYGFSIDSTLRKQKNIDFALLWHIYCKYTNHVTQIFAASIYSFDLNQPNC